MPVAAAYWGFCGGGVSGEDAAVPGLAFGAEVDVVVFEFFGGVFFFATGFFAVSVSSTTVFFSGAVASAAFAFWSCVRKFVNSASLPSDKASIRSAKDRRARCKAPRSFCSH